MPWIEREFIPPKKEQLNLRLDPDVGRLLNEYSGFLQSGQNYIVEQALSNTLRQQRRVPPRFMNEELCHRNLTFTLY